MDHIECLLFFLELIVELSLLFKSVIAQYCDFSYLSSSGFAQSFEFGGLASELIKDIFGAAVGEAVQGLGSRVLPRVGTQRGLFAVGSLVRSEGANGGFFEQFFGSGDFCFKVCDLVLRADLLVQSRVQFSFDCFNGCLGAVSGFNQILERNLEPVEVLEECVDLATDFRRVFLGLVSFLAHFIRCLILCCC